MNTKKVITAGLLVICWALVFFIISSDEVAGADYNNDINEVISANDAKEFLDELEYVLGVLEEAGMKSGKQIDFVSILFTYNILQIKALVK